MATPSSPVTPNASIASPLNAWGPLEILQDHLAAEERFVDGEKDRKQTDLTLARFLSSEELLGAIKVASIEQLDLALAHDALAVERKPQSCLLLLSAKANKMEQWRARRTTLEAKQQFAAASGRFLSQISQFLYQVPVSVASKEISRVSSLSVLYSAIAIDLDVSIKTLFPLKSLLRRFHQHGHTELTPIHSHFFYLCLHAKCYSAAMEILDQPLFEIHSQHGLVSSVDFLSYAYYGGLLYVGQKRYQEAIEFFTMACTAPAVSLSAFVIESYKKLVLVSLILNGKPPVLPKYTPFVVTRHVETHCVAYVELSKAFSPAKDVEKCVEVAQKHGAVFLKDGNLGLVKQVLDALKQKKLLQLTRTYVTIALCEMTKASGWVESEAVVAEKTLLELIAKGEMAAVIDKQKAMVKFVLEDEESEGALAGDAMLRLQEEMQKLMLVSSQLRAMDAEIVTSAKFQSRMQKDKERRQQRGGAHNQQGDDRLPLGAGGMDTME
ncbi:Cop9 signalosome complex subunit 3, partial [Globisporangium splendens]